MGNSQAEVVFGHRLRPDLPAQLRLHLLLSYGPPLLPRPPFPKRLPRPTLQPEEIFPAAVGLITAHQIVSGSFLQRHLGLGYHRTGQLLEELVAAGVIRRREDGGYEVVQNIVKTCYSSFLNDEVDLRSGGCNLSDRYTVRKPL